MLVHMHLRQRTSGNGLASMQSFRCSDSISMPMVLPAHNATTTSANSTTAHVKHTCVSAVVYSHATSPLLLLLQVALL
jgi:hypothetical protein